MNDERTTKDDGSTKSTPDPQTADAPKPSDEVAAKKVPAQKPRASSPLETAKPTVTARRPISKEEYARTTRELADSTSVIPVVSDGAKKSAPVDAKPAVSKPGAKKSAPKPDGKTAKKPVGGPTKAAAPVTAEPASKRADVTTKQAPVADPKKSDDSQTASSVARAALKKSPTGPATKSAPKPATVSSTSDRRSGRRQLTFVDPWSVSKMAFVVSVALMIVAVVAVVVFWFVLQVTGVWQALNDSVANVLSDGSGTFDVTDYLSLGRLTGLALIISALNVVFMTALATIAAHLYNLAAGLLGGVEVTFEDPS